MRLWRAATEMSQKGGPEYLNMGSPCAWVHPPYRSGSPGALGMGLAGCRNRTLHRGARPLWSFAWPVCRTNRDLAFALTYGVVTSYDAVLSHVFAWRVCAGMGSCGGLGGSTGLVRAITDRRT